MIESEVPFQQPLPSVDPSEIAFAMALFVAAAKGQIHGPNIGVSGFPKSENRFELYDDPLVSEESETLEAQSESAPLSRAVSVLWHHYSGDERQRAIWSRVVAFHVMMVGCQGSIVEHWIKPCEDDADSAFLNPAVVHAVATAKLHEFGQFGDALFVETVKQFTRFSLVAVGPVPLPARDEHQFRVFENLRRSVVNLSGRQGFESLLSRALIGPASKFPWLRTGQQLTPSELFERIDQSQSYPSKIEAEKAETAVVASLVELLNVLLGEGVTMRLLRNAWAQEDVRREG